MKKTGLSIGLILVLLVVGCAPATPTKKTSKITFRKRDTPRPPSPQTTSKVTIRKKGTPSVSSAETAIHRLVRKTAEKLYLLDEHNEKQITIAFPTTSSNKTLVSRSQFYSDTIEKYLVRYSQPFKYSVLNDPDGPDDSISGTRIHRPDYRLRCAYTFQDGHTRISINMIDIGKSVSVAIFSERFRDKYAAEIADYIVSQNTVHDKVTGLTWSKVSKSTPFDYQTAKSYCSGLIVDGMDDWRMPTKKEVFTIIARPVRNKEKLFGFDYGLPFKNRQCHWYDNSGKRSPTGVDLNSGKEVNAGDFSLDALLSKSLECQLLCVQ